MKLRDTLRSNLDRSINLIFDLDDGGKIETRAVQRTDDTLIIYLSSDIGCHLSCRMCHLTQTSQVISKPINSDIYVKQAVVILSRLKVEDRFTGVKNIHYNFMAQGDALSNENFISDFNDVHGSLISLTAAFVKDVSVKFKISTIFPNDSKVSKLWVRDALALDEEIEFYYSLYSLKSEFRKRWIPKASDPELVGQIFSGLDHGLRLHHALIKGLNDTEEDVALIHDWLERHNLNVIVNIVRYNPFSDKFGTESDDDDIQTYVNQMNLSHRVNFIQVIPKVGTDVFASCGMFVDK